MWNSQSKFSCLQFRTFSTLISSNTAFLYLLFLFLFLEFLLGLYWTSHFILQATFILYHLSFLLHFIPGAFLTCVCLFIKSLFRWFQSTINSCIWVCAHMYTSIIFFISIFPIPHVLLSQFPVFIFIYPEKILQRIIFNYLSCCSDNKIPKYEFPSFFLMLILLRCFVILIPL